MYTILIQLGDTSSEAATIRMIEHDGDQRRTTPVRRLTSSGGVPPSVNIPALQPKSERKAAKTLSAILLAFVITWTPYNVLVLIKTVAPSLMEESNPVRSLKVALFCFL